jgi:osmotically inducible lipoprotein OsmB
MRRGIATSLVLIPLALSLAGCGYDRGDRALSGGLIGAGGGAAIAAVTGGSPLVGAATGGGAGRAGRCDHQRPRHQPGPAGLALTGRPADTEAGVRATSTRIPAPDRRSTGPGLPLRRCRPGPATHARSRMPHCR